MTVADKLDNPNRSERVVHCWYDGEAGIFAQISAGGHIGQRLQG